MNRTSLVADSYDKYYGDRTSSVAGRAAGAAAGSSCKRLVSSENWNWNWNWNWNESYSTSNGLEGTVVCVGPLTSGGAEYITCAFVRLTEPLLRALLFVFLFPFAILIRLLAPRDSGAREESTRTEGPKINSRRQMGSICWLLLSRGPRRTGGMAAGQTDRQIYISARASNWISAAPSASVRAGALSLIDRSSSSGRRRRSDPFRNRSQITSEGRRGKGGEQTSWLMEK